ncbi:DUF309 domain-containing protein [Mesorhizobium caraganae]|uniref:DUF309 domain-containing protein n=1 Tax=Mesorhizobium caraganae TaxID=483206 RepID=UPI00289ACFA2|nr:DUF309 domain-containing protein [Mesorhizobium caraganae]
MCSTGALIWACRVCPLTKDSLTGCQSQPRRMSHQIPCDVNCHQRAFMIAGYMSRPRLLPEKNFPSYAYLPGKHPHPVRDPLGHSYQSDPVTVVAVEEALSSHAFRWGIDLFNHGYYWEAHEAWEPLWHAAKQSAQHRQFFKGLILLAAAGVRSAKESGSLPRAIRQGLRRYFIRWRFCRAGPLRPHLNSEIYGLRIRP